MAGPEALIPTQDPFRARRVNDFNQIQKRVWDVSLEEYCQNRDTNHCSPARGGATKYTFKNRVQDARYQPYTCKLNCLRCAFRIENTGAAIQRGEGPARQCRNRTCFGLPYCHAHLKKLGLKIAPSPGRGMGLFATKFFEKDSTICFMSGQVMTAQEVQQTYPGQKRPYVFMAGKERGVDCACWRSAGSMINEVSHDPRERNRLTNAKFMSRLSEHGSVRIQATKDIHPGQEIYITYGRAYDRSHYNE